MRFWTGHATFLHKLLKKQVGWSLHLNRQYISSCVLSTKPNIPSTVHSAYYTLTPSGIVRIMNGWTYSLVRGCWVQKRTRKRQTTLHLEQTTVPRVVVFYYTTHRYVTFLIYGIPPRKPSQDKPTHDKRLPSRSCTLSNPHTQSQIHRCYNNNTSCPI